MSEEIKKRFTKRDIYSVAIVAVVMILLTRLIPLFTANLTFLFYIFIIIPIVYLVGGAVLGWQVQKNSRIVKIIPVVLSSLSIFEIFNIGFDYGSIFCSIIVFLGSYCFFTYAYNIALLNIQKKTGRIDIIKWNLDHTLSWKLIFILIVFAVYYVSSMPFKTDLYVEQAKAYLKDKYHQDFSRYKARCNLWKLDYVLYFYPSSEPGIRFLVTLNAFDKGFTDYYKSVNYNWECYLLAKPYLDQITKDYFFLQKDIFLCPAFTSEGKLKFDNKAWGEIVYTNPRPVSKVISEYSGKLEYVCRVDLSYDLTDKNIDHVYKAVFGLMEKLKSENIKYYQILLSFYPKSFFKNETIRDFCDKNPGPLGAYGYFPTDEIDMDSNDNPIEIYRWQDVSKYLDKYSKSKITK